MKKNGIFFCLAILMAGCSSKIYQAESLAYKGYRIEGTAKKDPKLLQLLQPYRDSVNKSMNDIIGTVTNSLERAQPEGTLGNFTSDAMRAIAINKYKRPVDIAFVNHEGIRLTQLAAGPVTIGKVFELMPFDNLLILQELKGSVLQTLLDHISEMGGWPVSGATWRIHNKKAVDVVVNGKPLELNATYTVANSDYIANGGDDCSMLKPIPQINNGYLMRDALIVYIQELTAAGKTIGGTMEGRVKADN